MCQTGEENHMAERDHGTASDQGTPVRLLLTVEAAAERLSISRTRMYALIKSGEVMSVRVGRLRRVPVAAGRLHRTSAHRSARGLN
jgi:excisionase family DNA binding protein